MFQQIFEYKKEFKKTYDGKPPKFLKEIDWHTRKYFTTGLIDTEAGFYLSQGHYYFDITMVNKYFMGEIAEAFDIYAIPYKSYIVKNEKYKDRIKIRSYGRFNCRLIKEIFNIKNEKHLKKLVPMKITDTGIHVYPKKDI